MANVIRFVSLLNIAKNGFASEYLWIELNMKLWALNLVIASLKAWLWKFEASRAYKYKLAGNNYSPRSEIILWFENVERSFQDVGFKLLSLQIEIFECGSF